MLVMLSQSQTMLRSWRLEESAPATHVYGFGITCVLNPRNHKLEDRGH